MHDRELAEDHFIRANTLFQLGQLQQAVESYDQVLRLTPGYAEAHHNRALALHALARYPEALRGFDNALQLRPGLPEAHFNRASTLYALHQYQAAIDSYDKAISINPALAEAWYNRGVVLQAVDHLQPAIESYGKAIELKPAYPEACQNRGSALLALLEYHAALNDFDQAISLQPNFADAHYSRGLTLFALEQYAAALASFDRVAIIQPNYDWLPGIRFYLRQTLCHWTDYESALLQLEAAIARGDKAALPFTVLAASTSPAILKRVAKTFVREKYSAPPTLTPLSPHPAHHKLRIGYFSADYHNHATSHLMAEVFERHDRNSFEIFGFSFGPDTQDAMRQRVSAAFDRFIDVRTMSDRDVAQLSRSLELDIAIDLKGFTTESRPRIFAERAAPIQASYLGYPGTMGAAFIDYLIADHTLIPESAHQHYSEKIVYLPDTYQPNGHRAISTQPTSRSYHALPESAFVFCSFNSAYKITPTVFDTWMRILAEVPHSVLWLLASDPSAANLRHEAVRRGVHPPRLIFAQPLPAAEHLARLRLADLFLDTFPYTAHTTASDALWAGLPVLTYIGETFPSRVAASLLHAIRLPELITQTSAEYEQLAIQLAQDSQRYSTLRACLHQNRLTTPLFDCAAFTRHLESAYLAMHHRYRSGLAPTHLHIAAEY